MEVINLTPHVINVLAEAGEVSYPPSGSVARVTTAQAVVGHINGIPVSRNQFSEVTGVPSAMDGVVYLVSAMVAGAVKRADVISPDTGPSAIREGGNIVAVRGFVSWA